MTHNPQALLEQLRRVLATALGAPVQLVPGTMAASGWRLRVSVAGEQPLNLTFDAEGATALAAAMGSGTPKPEDIAAALGELCSHAFAEAAADGADVQISTAEPVEESPVQGVTVVGLSCDKLAAPLAVSLARDGLADSRRAAPVKPERNESGRLGVLMDIELPMVVRFGCTDMPLKALSNLGPGSLIDLSRAPEDPVEVLVGGRVVAHGEVVVVSGSYGIRIVDVVEGRSQALGIEA
jgi:flagellar motor switch protein FliN/FliY